MSFNFFRENVIILALDSREDLIKWQVMESNNCSDRSMEVKLPALLGNYDRLRDGPIVSLE